MKDDIPVERKFGYAHTMERHLIEAELEAAGVPMPDRMFQASAIQMERHKNDPSFRERQEAARALAPTAAPSLLDRYREALEAIRDGHNDPRDLARKVLE
ncbi:hypothetical protein [Mesorhizobium sp. M8A.F.Ca.ET.021.01.1.1]|uniref:hypothetical protein n=1 Tax=Mesorhizobium sp. M8A.F.Ca.ET.021.01.1.1 TaxID=2496757 RepID=UPI000FCC8148|nr:hypothetical protein [Mesorhizobium sp. M8A.F.Ca.ET.021.01.1.1]RUW56835.1 hypothetical protein EOA36_02225 [Mesorhizobium sp. M8A.F.Ca.ET.021.01.1.1]